MLPVVRRGYHLSSDRYTFLFDLGQYQLGLDYVPILDYRPHGTYSASQLKKEFKLKEAQLKTLLPVALTHGLWGEYYVYDWPQKLAISK